MKSPAARLMLLCYLGLWGPIHNRIHFADPNQITQSTGPNWPPGHTWSTDFYKPLLITDSENELDNIYNQFEFYIFPFGCKLRFYWWFATFHLKIYHFFQGFFQVDWFLFFYLNIWLKYYPDKFLTINILVLSSKNIPITFLPNDKNGRFGTEILHHYWMDFI